MHRPVGPAVLAELPGTVQRIDDPYPLRGQPRLVVDALFGQHGITGATDSQFGGQELVRQPVARLPQRIPVTAATPQVEQQLPGRHREIPREHMVVGCRQAGSSRRAVRG
jgi:hypothetical protein